MKNFFDTALYKRVITGIFFLSIFFFTFFKFSYLFSLFILSILIVILFFEWPKLLNPKKLNFWLITPIYPILPFLLIILLNSGDFKYLLFYIFTLVFAFDTGAFVVGKIFGRHKICPKISPGKTWEGFLGGFLLVCIIFYILLIINNNNFSTSNVILLSIIISLLASAGDLFESFLKRRAKIKDSGNFLPGHGGFLDRFDSMLFVVPFIYIFKNCLIIFFK